MPDAQPTAAEQLAVADNEIGERGILAHNCTRRLKQINRQRAQLKNLRAEHDERIDELSRLRPALADKARAEADKAAAEKAKAPVPEVKADPAAAAAKVGAKRGRPAKPRIPAEEPKPVVETNGQPVNV